MKYFFIPLLGLLVFATVSGQASAEHATLKQQILPIDCVFETVNDGSGTIHYLTPAECGQIIPPTDDGDNKPTPKPDTPRVTRTRNALLPTQDSTPRTPDGNGSNDSGGIITGRGVLINDHAESLTSSGYDVTVRKGNVLFYQPRNDANAPVRTILISNVDSHGVAFTVQPMNIDLLVTKDGPLSFDHQPNGQPAIKLTVKELYGDGSARLNIQLLDIAPVAAHRSTVLQVIVLVGSLMLLLVLRFGPQWLRGLHGPQNHS
jgi:hypothetical protein